MQYKKLSLAAAIALTPTLFALMPIVPDYLMRAPNVSHVVENVSNYLKKLKIAKISTPQQIKPVVEDIATRFGLAPIDVLFLLHASGIRVEEQLIPEEPEELVSTIPEGSALPILALDPNILTAALKKGYPPGLIMFLVQWPEIREAITKRGPRGEDSPLAMVFPLHDPVKAVILAKAFGLRTLMAAGRDRGLAQNLLSLETAEALLPYVFDKPDDLLELLSSHTTDKPFLFELRPDTRDYLGETVLMKLIQYKNFYTNSDAAFAHKALRVLIHQGNVNAVDARGETALIKAVRMKDLGAIRLLLDKGANVAHTDNSGMSAFDYARGNPAIEQILSANVNAVDALGETALIKAVRMKDLEAIKLLLDKGANVVHTDNRGMNAFDYARGNPAIVQLLSAKDASLKLIASQQPDEERVKL